MKQPAVRHSDVGGVSVVRHSTSGAVNYKLPGSHTQGRPMSSSQLADYEPTSARSGSFLDQHEYEPTMARSGSFSGQRAVREQAYGPPSLGMMDAYYATTQEHNNTTRQQNTSAQGRPSWSASSDRARLTADGSSESDTAALGFGGASGALGLGGTRERQHAQLRRGSTSISATQAPLQRKTSVGVAGMGEVRSMWWAECVGVTGAIKLTTLNVLNWAC